MSIITIQIKAGLAAGYKGRSKVVNVPKLGFDREHCLYTHQDNKKIHKKETSHMFMTQVPTSFPMKWLHMISFKTRDITYFKVNHIQQTKETKRF